MVVGCWRFLSYFWDTFIGQSSFLNMKVWCQLTHDENVKLILRQLWCIAEGIWLNSWNNTHIPQYRRPCTAHLLLCQCLSLRSRFQCQCQTVVMSLSSGVEWSKAPLMKKVKDSLSKLDWKINISWMRCHSISAIDHASIDGAVQN